MSTLQSKLETLAAAFARDVLAVLRGVSIDDIAALSARGGRPASSGRAAAGAAAAAPARAARGARRGKGGRRTAADIDAVVDRIVELLAKSPEGLRSEQVQAELGLTRREVPRPLKAALASGRIGKRGERRATVYYAGAGGAVASPRRRRAGGRKKKAG